MIRVGEVRVVEGARLPEAAGVTREVGRVVARGVARVVERLVVGREVTLPVLRGLADPRVALPAGVDPVRRVADEPRAAPDRGCAAPAPERGDAFDPVDEGTRRAVALRLGTTDPARLVVFAVAALAPLAGRRPPATEPAEEDPFGRTPVCLGADAVLGLLAVGRSPEAAGTARRVWAERSRSRAAWISLYCAAPRGRAGADRRRTSGDQPSPWARTATAYRGRAVSGDAKTERLPT